MKPALPDQRNTRRCGPSLRACLHCALLCSVLTLLTGCQEDDRATRTTSARAAELADSRLDKATGELFETLGQKKPASNLMSAAKAPKALSWTPPQTREDGSLLQPDQIAGFRIYYRLRHQGQFQVMSVDDPQRTSQPLTDLPPGAYEFSITTVDAQGLESRRSEPVLVELI